MTAASVTQQEQRQRKAVRLMPLAYKQQPRCFCSSRRAARGRDQSSQRRELIRKIWGQIAENLTTIRTQSGRAISSSNSKNVKVSKRKMNVAIKRKK